MKFTLLSIILSFATANASSGMWKDATLPNSITNSHNGFDSVVTPQGRQLVVHVDSNTKLMLSERVNPISDWTTDEIFDAQLFSIRDVEFLSDDDGGLHLAFLTRGNIPGVSTALRYGYRAPGGDWNFTILEDADPSDSTDEGHELSLDLQTNGLAAIAYTGGNGTLRYISRSNAAFGAWFDNTVDDSPDSGLFPSLKHRSSFTETTFISHYDSNNEQLLFTSLTRPFGAPKFSWSTSTVDNLDNPGRFSSLGFTASGQVAIAYNTTFIGRELRFAVRDGGVWNREVVDAPLTDEQVGMHCHLSMDALSQPQITYTTGSFFLGEFIETNIEEIRHARALPDGSWGIESAVRFDTEEDPTENAFRMSLTTDPAGTPHAIYYRGEDEASNKLRHLRPYGSAWVTEDLSGKLPEGSLIRGASLDFTSDGMRVISVPVTSTTEDSPDPVHRIHLLTQKGDESSASWISGGIQQNSTRTLIHQDRRALILRHNATTLSRQERELGENAGIGSVIGSRYLDLENSGGYDLTIDDGGNIHVVVENGNTIHYSKATPPAPGEEIDLERQAWGFDFGEGHSPSIAIGPDGQVFIVYLGPDGLHPNPAPGQSMIKTAFLDEDAEEWQLSTIEEGTRLGRSVDIVYSLNEFHYLASEISQDGYSSSLIVGNPFSGERDLTCAVAGQIRKIVAKEKGGSVHVAWRSEHQNINSSDDRLVGDRYIGYFHFRQGTGVGPDLTELTYPTVAFALPDDHDRFSPTFDGLDIAIDQKGFPVILTNTAPDTGIFEAPGSLLLIRPADSLDLDRDGVSLLYESAFGMNPAVQDPELGGRNELTPIDGSMQFSTYFPHRSDLTPIIGTGPVLNESKCYLGAFELGIQFSRGNMRIFSDTVATPDLLPSQDLPGQAGFRETGFALTFGPGFVENTPKAFFRHTVRRVVPNAR